MLEMRSVHIGRSGREDTYGYVGRESYAYGVLDSGLRLEVDSEREKERTLVCCKIYMLLANKCVR